MDYIPCVVSSNKGRAKYMRLSSPCSSPVKCVTITMCGLRVYVNFANVLDVTYDLLDTLSRIHMHTHTHTHTHSHVHAHILTNTLTNTHTPTQLVVRAVDQGSPRQLTGIAALCVRVLDENDNAPMFSQVSDIINGPIFTYCYIYIYNIYMYYVVTCKC